MPKYFHYRFAQPDEEGNEGWDEQLESEQCGKVFPNGQRCKRRVIFGINACFQHLESVFHLRIAKSLIANAGDGLFAFDRKQDADAVIFNRDDVICPFNGVHITRETREEAYPNNAPYAVEVHHGLAEDGAVKRGMGSMANHQTNARANARFSITRENRVVLRAIKPIRNGEEIYVNYGRSYRFNDGSQHSTNNAKYKL